MTGVAHPGERGRLARGARFYEVATSAHPRYTSGVLTFITGNPAKAEQLGIHLDHPVAHQAVDLAEVQSLDLAEVVESKVRAAHEIVGGLVLVEDTSLVFDGLGRLPGPLIKWFLQELGNDGLCDLLACKDRRATASVLFGLYDGETLQTFGSSVAGAIAEAPRGARGFGWDPVFIPEGHGQTWGEMDAETQKQTSMRRVALAQLGEFLSA